MKTVTVPSAIMTIMSYMINVQGLTSQNYNAGARGNPPAMCVRYDRRDKCYKPVGWDIVSAVMS